MAIVKRSHSKKHFKVHKCWGKTYNKKTIYKQLRGE